MKLKMKRLRKWQGWDSKPSQRSRPSEAMLPLRLHSWKLSLGGLGNIGEVRRMPMKWKMGTDRAARTKMARAGLSQQGPEPRSSGR